MEVTSTELLRNYSHEIWVGIWWVILHPSCTKVPRAGKHVYETGTACFANAFPSLLWCFCHVQVGNSCKPCAGNGGGNRDLAEAVHPEGKAAAPRGKQQSSPHATFVPCANICWAQSCPGVVDVFPCSVSSPVAHGEAGYQAAGGAAYQRAGGAA